MLSTVDFQISHVGLWWSKSVIFAVLSSAPGQSHPSDYGCSLTCTFLNMKQKEKSWNVLVIKPFPDVHMHHTHLDITQVTPIWGNGNKRSCRTKGRTENWIYVLPPVVTLIFWIGRPSPMKLPICWVFMSWSRTSGVGLSGADEQLVPAHHPLPHVHLVQPDVGLPYQGLLHELASVGHQEKLQSRQRRHSLLSTHKNHSASPF